MSRRDLRPLPYELPQPTGMRDDLVIASALSLTHPSLDKKWVLQDENVWFKPLLLNVSQGFYINLLWVEKQGVLSRHRHSGPVHAFTMRGEWRYLEHDWVSREGDYAFEPPGETHTLVVPETPGLMVTLFHVTGGYTYVDTVGEALGYEDVFTKLDKTLAHYAAVGIPKSEAMAMVR